MQIASACSACFCHSSQPTLPHDRHPPITTPSSVPVQVNRGLLVGEHVPWILVSHFGNVCLRHTRDLVVFLSSTPPLVGPLEPNIHDAVQNGGKSHHRKGHTVPGDIARRVGGFIQLGAIVRPYLPHQ